MSITKSIFFKIKLTKSFRLYLNHKLRFYFKKNSKNFIQILGIIIIHNF